MNSFQEERLINSFKPSYSNFPEGTLVKVTPPPTAADYLLTTLSGKKIGIELTEAFHGEEVQRLSSSTYEFTNMVLAKLKALMPFTFSIDIDLDASKGIPKAKRNEIAEYVATFCFKEFAYLENYQHAEVTNLDIDLNKVDNSRIKSLLLSKGYRNLPEGIKRIIMSRVDSISESWNSRGEGGVIPHFTNECLNGILKKKEERLLKYEPCNQFWLIIKEGNYFAGSFHDIQISFPISSSFNKVFLYRTVEQKVIELK